LGLPNHHVAFVLLFIDEAVAARLVEGRELCLVVQFIDLGHRIWPVIFWRRRLGKPAK
jgi:hypothetical protein